MTTPASAALIRVLIVDDQALVRAGLAAMLSLAADLEVVGEAQDGVEAIALARGLRPDIVLMDVDMPRLDGIAATATIVREQIAKVLVLSTFDADRFVFDALRPGASGFILKDSPAEGLAPAIRTVMADQALLAPAVLQRLVLAHTPSRPEDPRRRAALARLTTREAQALDALAEGLSNAEIADLMGVAEATIKTYVSSVLLKLGLRDRLQAVIFAYECGIAHPRPARRDRLASPPV